MILAYRLVIEATLADDRGWSMARLGAEEINTTVFPLRNREILHTTGNPPLLAYIDVPGIRRP